MEYPEYEKSKIFRITDTLEYLPNAVVTRSILKKPTGTVNAVSIDSGMEMTGNLWAFDTMLQIIDGMAEITLEEQTFQVRTGEFIIIPAHTRNTIRAKEKFKMVSTVIKSGYEDIYL